MERVDEADGDGCDDVHDDFLSRYLTAFRKALQGVSHAQRVEYLGTI